MDDLDIEILKILIKDARKPFLEIARELGISKDRVRKRYEQLKKSFPSLKSSVILDFEKMGFISIMGFSIKAEKESNLPEIKNELFNCPRRGYLAEQVGDFDFYLDVYITDMKEAYETMEYLEGIEGIESLNPWFFRLNPDENLPSLNELMLYLPKTKKRDKRNSRKYQ